jgi:vancomycin resistance protein YoaR
LLATGLVAILALAAVVRLLQYDGVAKPGVHVLGVDVGGKSRAEITKLVDDWDAHPVTIAVGARTYHVQRGWLVSVDAAKTAARALSAGSTVALVAPKRVDVKPALGRAVSASNVLAAIAMDNRAPVSATVRLRGTRVVMTLAHRGVRLDPDRLLGLLEKSSSVVQAPFSPVRPEVTTAAARAAAARARALVAERVEVDYQSVPRGVLSRKQIARAVRFKPSPAGLDVSLAGKDLARILRPRFGPWIVHARNARFVVKGKAVRVAPSHAGLDLNASQVAAAVESAAAEGGVADITLEPRAPDLTTAKAKALGIKQRLVSYTTEMGPSSSNRIHNVHLMADFIDGTIIQPGEVFSFNRVVGPRTAKRGFLEGSEIIGSLVLPSIGGGVCQTATTLFNDAFDAGLPILERTNHNLYLTHYPLGRDATVSWGGPDLKFKNDLKHGILVKASYTDATLTFTFYGTSEGRRVVAHTGPQVRWTHPGLNYAVDLSARPNSVRVVPGSGELGFDVTVTRTVYTKDGKVLRHNTFKSHYIPDSSTAIYGPGKRPPGSYFVLPST